MHINFVLMDGNYIREEVTIPTGNVNVRAFYMMLPLLAITLIPYYLLWREHLTRESIREFVASSKIWNGHGMIFIFIMIVLGIIVHELIHGFTWAALVKGGWKSIRFGILWKELIPYCHCTEPMVIRSYRVGTIMPGLILGVAPTFLAYFTGNLWVALFGGFFTAAAAGDLMILDLLKKEDANTFVLDHPEKVGCIVFRKRSD